MHRSNQRGFPGLIADIDARPALDQRLDPVGEAHRCRQLQRGYAFLVADIGIGPALQQEPDPQHIAARDNNMEAGVARSDIAGVDDGAARLVEHIGGIIALALLDRFEELVPLRLELRCSRNSKHRCQYRNDCTGNRAASA